MMRTEKQFTYGEEGSSRGLTQEEAEARLKKHGNNEISQTKKISPFALFIEQFKDFITLVLVAATFISCFLGEMADAVTILLIIVMNAILGFIQEYRTEKSLEALKELSAPHATVVRNGKIKQIPAKEVVPGDILILEAGDRVSADCKLIQASNFQTNESILTGESVPVDKSAANAKMSHEVQNEKEHMLFMGTTVTRGTGRAVVLHTGMQTEMGKIANMLQSVDQEETPLKKRLNKIGKELVMICLGVCVLIIIAGIYHGESMYNMFLAGVSLAVAAIPEGLPAIVTVALAIGVQRMLKRNALVRKLPAVETLGCTNVICSDKTGTLTENKMTVKKIYTDGVTMDVTGNGYSMEGEFIAGGRAAYVNSGTPLKMLLTIGILCNNAEFQDGEAFGDPTEAAILIASKKGKVDREVLSSYKRTAEIPFDSDRKRMSVICRNKQNETYLFVKGAPDMVINLCTQKAEGNSVKMLTGTEKNQILAVNDKMAAQALRVLAFAYKKLDYIPRHLDAAELEKNLIFVGLEGMIDPPRVEAVEAVKNCHKAGVKPVMITGDHKVTAVAIAREIGLSAGSANVLTGEEIEMMSDRDLEKKVSDVSVYARVTPKHKLRIVKAFKKCRNIVAMTGDGVNDAPALKEADIGVAMGKGGTDVAKEASSMILLDDNFATIVAAIEEGRMIYDNIRKFIRYLLSCNLGEILMMGVAAFLGMSMPLVPIQILWVNLVTDGLPALALGVDPPDGDIMSRTPRKSNEGIFSGGLGSRIAFSGFLIGASSLAAFAAMMYLTHGNLLKARTVAFATMIIAELLYSFECKSEHKNAFEVGFFNNMYLVIANISSFLLMLVVIYIPFFSGIFKTYALDLREWLVVLIFAVIEFVVNSLIRYKE